MKNLKQKTKEWYENNKESIKNKGKKILDYVFIVGTFTFTAYVGGKITEYSIGRGLKKFHEDGLIKFFDISTGKEIGIKELNMLIDEMYGTK